MGDTYWWSRYGNFDPGKGVYPHMGQVFTKYRIKRGFPTQSALARAVGLSERSIQEIESTMSFNGPDSIERRQILAKLLRIPPALLALDWRFMTFQGENVDQEQALEGIDQYEQAQENIKRLLEEDTYSLYRSVLMMGRGYLYSGGPAYIGDTVENCTDKLIPIVRNTPEIDREPWQELLCRFFQLSTSFALRRLDKTKTLDGAQSAITLANEIGNTELLASAFYRRVRVHLDHRKTATSDKQKQHYLALAKKDILTTLDFTEKVGPTLKGNIYLIAAEVFSLDATDMNTRKKCAKWQEKAAMLVYRGTEEEDDGTFLKLNKTGLHHEKAKTLLQFGDIAEARNEIAIARKTVAPDMLTWHLNLFLTEANLYMAEGDLEASAICGSEAYKISKVVHSLKDEGELKRLFYSLKSLDNTNPQVCNFGVEMDIY
jgi:transcriptional regulator with XRE-family HTH domain